MKEIVFGTTNQAKVDQVRGSLSPAGIQVYGVADKSLLPTVVEDGTTAAENARKKSLAYAKALGRPVFSMDNALYLEGLPADKQPGLFVRRIPNGLDRPTDDQLREYYSKLIDGLGGKVNGYWEFGVCVANPDGNYRETVIKSPRIFVSQPANTKIDGYPLESLQIGLENGKYHSDMTKEERDLLWQKAIGGPLAEFIKSVELS